MHKGEGDLFYLLMFIWSYCPQAQSNSMLYLIIWKQLWSSEYNWSFHTGFQRYLFMALPIMS